MSFFNSDDLFANYSQETTSTQQEDTSVKATESVAPSTIVAKEVIPPAVTEVANTSDNQTPADKKVIATGDDTAIVEKIDTVNIQTGAVVVTIAANDVQVCEVVENNKSEVLLPELINQQETIPTTPQTTENTTSTDGLFSSDSLFEDLSKKADEAQKVKEEKEAKKKQAATKKATSTSTTVTSEDFNVNAETTIRYHREVLPILDFFTIEEVENGVQITKKNETVEYKKIDGELVRERMEKNGFLEFVKGFSQFNYFGKDGRNFIVPSTISKKKGNLEMEHIEVTEEVKSPSCDSTSFLFQYDKKIPFTIYGQFVALAKMFGRLNLEVLAEIYFNYDTNEFMLHIPRQQVNDLWCISKESPGEFQRKLLEEKGEYVELACELHSHHHMKCFPSSTDNASERKPKMFYVIVGETHNYIPSVSARTFVKEGSDGYHVKKSIYDIFTNDGIKDDSAFKTLPHFKASWIDIVR